MGYKGLYKVYNAAGKCLGTFSGWTADEAIKQCLIFHPNAEGLTAKSDGTMEHCK